jgi:ribosomal protein RSM22 (predicted rRNA methylase)
MSNRDTKLLILEEMTEKEVKTLVKNEIDKLLKKMVEEELEKVLKSNRDIKNQIGDVSKDILKKLYKDLSLHHTYVIDRVKV